MRFRTLVLSAMLALAPVSAALAHHGWTWTADGFFELTGIVKAVYVGNPHATIDLDVEGVVWRVELAPPGPTQAAGFTETTAKPGDEITAIGNRSLDANETRMKAVRVVVDGTNYDVYPARAPQ